MITGEGEVKVKVEETVDSPADDSLQEQAPKKLRLDDEVAE